MSAISLLSSLLLGGLGGFGEGPLNSETNHPIIAIKIPNIANDIIIIIIFSIVFIMCFIDVHISGGINNINKNTIIPMINEIILPIKKNFFIILPFFS